MCWNCNQKGHFQNQCSKLVASRDKVVNMAVGDSDDALICCVENTVEDHIMDSGASFHAKYCKEELERFKLRSGKHQRLGDMSRICMNMLASKSNVLDVRKSKFIQKAMVLHLLHQSDDFATMILLSKTAARVVFGVVKRLSRTFRAESTGLRVEAPKMLWSDSVSTTYLIYRISYVPIGLRIPKEERRGKDTSLTHLKVFGCDSFVKVKDVCGEAMKCTFIGSGSDEVRYSFRDTKSHQIKDRRMNKNFHGSHAYKSVHPFQSLEK
ncbi:retrovirus-related pol polyprotein from transposon TNT 1-94 [Tanacetum coccineum]